MYSRQRSGASYVTRRASTTVSRKPAAIILKAIKFGAAPNPRTTRKKSKILAEKRELKFPCALSLFVEPVPRFFAQVIV